MKTKTLTIEIPEDVLKQAKRKGVSSKDLKNFLKTSLELDSLFLFSRMKAKDVETISKKIGRNVWARL